MSASLEYLAKKKMKFCLGIHRLIHTKRENVQRFI